MAKTWLVYCVQLGCLSDLFGPRTVMYWALGIMLISVELLALPNNALGYSIDVWSFTALVFIIGCGMGIGKAAVYKYVTNYFPKDVAAVGGMVGLLGALGGFFLPLMFGYLNAWTGWIQTPFIVLFALVAGSFLWMHVSVLSMKRKEPEMEKSDLATA